MSKDAWIAIDGDSIFSKQESDRVYPTYIGNDICLHTYRIDTQQKVQDWIASKAMRLIDVNNLLLLVCDE